MPTSKSAKPTQKWEKKSEQKAATPQKERAFIPYNNENMLSFFPSVMSDLNEHLERCEIQVVGLSHEFCETPTSSYWKVALRVKLKNEWDTDTFFVLKRLFNVVFPGAVDIKTYNVNGDSFTRDLTSLVFVLKPYQG